MIATFELPAESARTARSESVRKVRAELRPLGIWGSLCWGLVALAQGLLGIDAGSKAVAAAYRAAKLAGMLAALWLAVVIAAPVSEELLFRGFLHRGWAPSWLGIAGTIILTSALWAALHQQYNWFGI